MSASVVLGLALALASDNGNYNATASRDGTVTERVSLIDDSLNCPYGTATKLTESEFKEKTHSWSPEIFDRSRPYRVKKNRWKGGSAQDGAFFVPPSLWHSSGRLEYPKKFLQKFRRGKVVVTVLIDELGGVSEAFVSCSSDDFFNESALEYARRMSFYPGTLEGRVVRSVAHQPMNFDAP